MEPFSRHEKMLQLCEELLAVEEERAAGRAGCTLDKLDSLLDDVISRMEDISSIQGDAVAVRSARDIGKLQQNIHKSFFFLKLRSQLPLIEAWNENAFHGRNGDSFNPRSAQ